MTTEPLKITLDCSSGAELLFGGVKKHDIQLEGNKKWCVGDFLNWLRDNKLTERADLFMQGNTVRPGLLVLINDTDWELMGELDYKLQAGDNVLLISTLHGG